MEGGDLSNDTVFSISIKFYQGIEKILACDALYRPKLVSDGKSQGTQMLYNAAGYAWKTIYPNGDVMQYNSFDNLGNPTQRQDGRGILTNYFYNDVETRLTDVQDPAAPGIKVHLHYDSYGRMDSMTDGSGSAAFTFDDMDGKLTNTTTYTGLAAKTLTNGYYPNGSRSSPTLPDSTTAQGEPLNSRIQAHKPGHGRIWTTTGSVSRTQTVKSSLLPPETIAAS